jgi:hypothetical protein
MKKYGLILIPSLLFLISCNQQSDRSHIVLKIGSLKITKYEYNRNKHRELEINSNIEKKPTLKDWNKQFIDKCFFIVDAYDKKYDTLTSIKKNIYYTSKIMMTQQYGYLWGAVVEPEVYKFQELSKEKIDKRKKLFYFDYISTNNIDNLKNILSSDSLIDSYMKYKRLKDKCQSNKSFFSTGYFSTQWPFNSFWKYKDYLFNLKEKTVSKLIYINNNYYYLYLDHIETLELDKEELDKLKTELRIGKEIEIDEKRTEEMNHKGNLKFNYENINKITDLLERHRELSSIDYNTELIQYVIDNKVVKLNFRNFLDFNNSTVFHKPISSKSQFISSLNQYYYNEYLNNEAIKLGLYKLDTFLLDEKNYENNLLYNYYIQKYVTNTISIDSSEILKYYLRHKTLFIQPENLKADIYIFDNPNYIRNSAYKIKSLLLDKKINETRDTNVIKGLNKVILDFNINLETDRNQFSKGTFNDIDKIKIPIVSMEPLIYKNKYVILYIKDSNGKCFMAFDQVYNRIREFIELDKSDIIRRSILENIKKKYKIEINEIEN